VKEEGDEEREWGFHVIYLESERCQGSSSNAVVLDALYFILVVKLRDFPLSGLMWLFDVTCCWVYKQIWSEEASSIGNHNSHRTSSQI
jgi:hypothetical protein